MPIFPAGFHSYIHGYHGYIFKLKWPVEFKYGLHRMMNMEREG